MSTIGKNIRKIRTVKKLSQAAFAELFNLARPSVGAYEEGRAEPKIETVIQMANHFGISIDSLLTKELTINELYKFDIHAKELTNQLIKEKTQDDIYTNIRSVYVPGAKQIEYIVHLGSKDFLSGLSKILIPGFEKENVRAFEMTTEEMHDNFKGINNEDIVVGKKVDHKESKNFKPNKVYVFIFPNELSIRRLESVGGNFILKADNPNFSIKKADPAEILETWEVVGYFSKNIKPPSILTERVMYLENVVEKLESRIKKIEKQSGI